MVENFYLFIDPYKATLSVILKMLFKTMKNMCSYAFCANSDRSTRLSYANTFMLKGSACTFLPHLHLIFYISLLNFDQKIFATLFFELQAKFSKDLIRG